MARYPKHIMNADRATKDLYDLAQSVEQLAKRAESKTQEVETRADAISEKADRLERDKSSVASQIMARENEIRQAFANWDTLTESQFRMVVKRILRALLINEIKGDQDAGNN